MHIEVSAQDRLPVVVAVDGSRAGLATLDFATAEAVRRGARLTIVHVWPGRYAGPFRSRGPVPDRDDGRRLLDIAATRAALAAPGLPIETEMLDGAAGNVLVGCSERARLIVVGHRDEIVTRPSWGSTTAYLAHHSACPFLVHRGSSPQHGPVVVAVSARSGPTATLGYAFTEAARLDERLVAVHVWSRGAARNTSPTPGDSHVAERQSAEHRLARELSEWSTAFPDVGVERVAVHDLDIGYTLERASRRGRLLVAGMGRNGSFAEMLYGSVSLAMARQAPCPVLLVPPGWPAPIHAKVRDDGAAAR
jgi:nucleotide-binding universal stress UspA family protein